MKKQIGTKSWMAVRHGTSNKNIRKSRVIGVCLMLSFLVLCLVSASENICYSKAAEDKATAETKLFDIQATFGFDNVARVGKSMLANVTVTNNGEDFSGLLQILVPATGEDNVMYQNELSIAAGETKNVCMPMYVSHYTKKIIVNITDNKENVISKKRVKIKLLTAENEARTMAILTDNKDVLGYWEYEYSDVFYLSGKDIPEQEAGFDFLDVLIINDFDTHNLNEKQYEALKNWISRGGNLVIGTGVNGNRTLGVFQDDFLTGTFGEANQNGKIDITLDDASVFTDKKNGIYLQRVEKDLGAVLVFSDDLGVDYANWKKKGAAFRDMIDEHILEVVQTDNYTYSDEYGLWLTDKVKIPNIKIYAIVLCIYVIVVSWILYIVLRAKDKLEWTWGLVPAFALVFAIIVYGIGSSTRITEPFISYVRVIERMGEQETIATENTRIGVTSPYNEKYSITVPEGRTVFVGKNEGDYYEEDGTNFIDYNIGFCQSGNQQTVTLKDMEAFETSTFRMDDVVSADGSYEADISCDKYQYSGTFTNKTGSDIHNAVFLSDGFMYKMGTVKNGETVKISEKCKNIMANDLTSYTMVEETFNELIGQVKDENGKKDHLTKNRYTEALNHYFSEKGNSIFTQARVIGFIDSKKDNESMEQSWGLDCSGITITTFAVDVNYTDENGETFVPDLVYYGNAGNEMYERSRTFDVAEFTVEYSLKSNETLTGLYYLSASNSELKEDPNKKNTTYLNGGSFEGDIYAYNYKTKSYEKLFDGDKPGEVKDVKRFVGEDNKVLLKMKLKDGEDGWECSVPVISATKQQK